jgi:hypothetical protein
MLSHSQKYANKAQAKTGNNSENKYIFKNGIKEFTRNTSSTESYTGYFTNDYEPGGIENATYNTLERKPGHGGDKYPAFPPDVLWVAFAITPGSLSLVKYPVFFEIFTFINTMCHIIRIKLVNSVSELSVKLYTL